jgi:hypothetical protein
LQFGDVPGARINVNELKDLLQPPAGDPHAVDCQEIFIAKHQGKKVNEFVHLAESNLA